jgi:hypothetical protein
LKYNTHTLLLNNTQVWIMTHSQLFTDFINGF